MFWKEGAMERRPWLERVADELTRRGVPAGYRSRLLAELADHIHDLKEEVGMSCETVSDERLGRPAEVAAGVAEHCRRAGWVRRHPVLVFGLAPLPAAVVIEVLLVAGFALSAEVFEGLNVLSDSSVLRPVAGRALLIGAYLILGYGAALAGLALFGRLALRYMVDWRWLAAAAIQLCIYAGLRQFEVRYSDIPGESSVSVGLSAAFGGWERIVNAITVGYIVQVGVPLVVAGWLLWRCRRESGSAVAAA